MKSMYDPKLALLALMLNVMIFQGVGFASSVGICEDEVSVENAPKQTISKLAKELGDMETEKKTVKHLLKWFITAPDLFDRLLAFYNAKRERTDYNPTNLKSIHIVQIGMINAGKILSLGLVDENGIVAHGVWEALGLVYTIVTEAISIHGAAGGKKPFWEHFNSKPKKKDSAILKKDTVLPILLHIYISSVAKKEPSEFLRNKAFAAYLLCYINNLENETGINTIEQVLEEILKSK
jgi:hypothetical protein